MKISILTLSLLSILLLSGNVIADQRIKSIIADRGLKVTERWSCSEWNDSKVILDAYIFETVPELDENEEGHRIASVKSFGETSYGVYSKGGIEKRWDFGLGGNYSLTIRPNGDGFYFDRSNAKQGESTTSTMSFSCKRSKK